MDLVVAPGGPTYPEHCFGCHCNVIDDLSPCPKKRKFRGVACPIAVHGPSRSIGPRTNGGECERCWFRSDVVERAYHIVRPTQSSICFRATLWRCNQCFYPLNPYVWYPLSLLDVRLGDVELENGLVIGERFLFQIF